MGLESATYVSQLTRTNPTSSDTKSQGDDHLRLVKTVLQNTFPNASKPLYFPDTVTKTADYVVLATDDNKIIVVDTTAGDVDLTLPSLGTGDAGWSVGVYVSVATNNVNVLPPSGTISGGTSVVMTELYEVARFRWTGSSYFVDQDNLTLALRNITESRLLGRGQGSGDGAMQEIQLSGLILTGDVLSTTLVPPLPPQGYLTLSSTADEPIISSDKIDITTLAYDFDVGDLMPISDATEFSMKHFTRQTLALTTSAHTAGNRYDVYAFMDGTTLRIGTGPAWSTPTVGSSARGTGGGTAELQRFAGVRVNKNAMTMTNGASTYPVAAKCGTLLGSISISTAGKLTCHIAVGTNRLWEVSNIYNQRRLVLVAADATASWVYNVATIRASNADSNNKVTPFFALADRDCVVRMKQAIAANGVGTLNAIGIGANSITTYSGTPASFLHDTGTQMSDYAAEYRLPPTLGTFPFNALEAGKNGITCTFNGTETNMRLVAEFFG